MRLHGRFMCCLRSSSWSRPAESAHPSCLPSLFPTEQEQCVSHQKCRKDVLSYATHRGLTPNDGLLGSVRASEQGRGDLSPRAFDGGRSRPLPGNVECALLFSSPSRRPLAS